MSQRIKMKLQLNSLKYYILTYRNPKRREHVLQELRGYDITFIESIPQDSTYKSGAMGHSKIFDKAIQKNSFEPFVVLEDDIKKYRDFPDEIQIPNDTDILYIGISKCAYEKEDWGFQLVYQSHDDNVIRIYNMLSTHGYIICSIRGLLLVQKSLLEGYFKNKPWDIFMTQMQPHYHAYALKRPLIYQCKELGGAEHETKFELEDSFSNSLPTDWINHSNISILSNAE